MCSQLTWPLNALKFTLHLPSNAAGCVPAMAFLALSANDGSSECSGSGNDEAHSLLRGPSPLQRSISSLMDERNLNRLALVLRRFCVIACSVDDAVIAAKLQENRCRYIKHKGLLC